MDEYIGRVNELEMLESRWKSEEFEFGAIYGRRRVGKTSLIQKFMEGKKGIRPFHKQAEEVSVQPQGRTGRFGSQGRKQWQEVAVCG